MDQLAEAKEIAQIVKDTIHFYDKRSMNDLLYNYVKSCSSNIHSNCRSRFISTENKIESKIKNVLDMNVQFPIVTDILRLIKGSTARECNKILNHTGSFWQHESYESCCKRL
jgi:hypothetical protein